MYKLVIDKAEKRFKKINYVLYVYITCLSIQFTQCINKCQVPKVPSAKCQMPKGAKCQVPSAKCQVPKVPSAKYQKSQVPNAKCQKVPSAKCQVPKVPSAKKCQVPIMQKEMVSPNKVKYLLIKLDENQSDHVHFSYRKI